MAKKAKIVVSKNGPYIVTGAVPVVMQTITPNKEGFSWDWTPGKIFKTDAETYLCRCGQSKAKPFCDGSHEKVRFDGKETASRKPYDAQAEIIDGPGLKLQDAENLCAFARFCDPNGQVWSQVEHTDDAKTRENFVRQVGDCPSGRLVAWKGVDLLLEAFASVAEPVPFRRPKKNNPLGHGPSAIQRPSTLGTSVNSFEWAAMNLSNAWVAGSASLNIILKMMLM